MSDAVHIIIGLISGIIGYHWWTLEVTQKLAASAIRQALSRDLGVTIV